jgi:putative cell wall-binding protein
MSTPVGGDLSIEEHAISDASTSSPLCDEDWIRFQCNTSVARDREYVIEADMRGCGPGARPVLEAYGPFSIRDFWGGGPLPAPSVPPTVSATDLGDPQTLCTAASVGDRWHGEGFASLAVLARLSQYFVRVRPWRDDPAAPDPSLRNYGDHAGPYALRYKHGLFSRVAGVGRVQTAVEISREMIADSAVAADSSGTFGHAVVVASGWNYADGLAGSALAGQMKVPLLLTSPTSLSASAAVEIERLQPETIYVLGGSAAISNTVYRQLAAYTQSASDVIRLAGWNRVATSYRIADEVYKRRGGEPLRGAFIVNGWAFPDALAASPMAALNEMPILSTHGGSLDQVTEQAIRDFGIRDVIIVGGSAAVAPAVESRLVKLLGASHVRRKQGATRYETAKEFAVWAAAMRSRSTSTEGYRVGTAGSPSLMQALHPENVAVASGQDFPDALAAGVWCGRAQAPLLLTQPDSLSPYIYSSTHRTPTGTTDYSTDVTAQTGAGMMRSYLIGGEAAVGKHVLVDLDRAAGLP